MKRILAAQLRRLADRLDAPAALGLAGPVPGDTPVLVLFHHYQAVLRALETYEPVAGMDEDDEQVSHLFERLAQLKDELMVLPSTGTGDFAAKVIVDTCRGSLFSEWETGALWVEARALTGAEI